MCMKNVNSVVSVEATDGAQIITELDGTKKVFPINTDKKIKLLVTYLASIVNGKREFFKDHPELSFKIVLTDENNIDCCELTKFTTKLNVESENYHKTKYVDFISEEKVFISDIDFSKFKTHDSKYYITILVGDYHPVSVQWIVQSSIPIYFKENNKNL